MPDLAITPLDDLTVLDLRGADVVEFLDGQLSQDVSRLAAQGALLAGLHNPQGRVIALLRLFHLADDHVLAVLPAALANDVRALLGRYVLRAKVRIEDAGATWEVYGLTGPDAEAAAGTRLHMSIDAEGWRQMIVAPRGETRPQAEPVARGCWRNDDIAAGIPEVLPATSAQFVAQMLNLDLLGAVSFSKGCYTGQEVIARAHYRGQVKRRMQRFLAESDHVPSPGERLRLPDGRAAQVISAARGAGGALELLAVAPLPGIAQAAADATAGEPTDALQAIRAQALPLPYAT